MIVLDIETVPLASALETPYPEATRTPPGNYKSEDAIAKWRTNDRAEWQQGRAKECSLNPRLGRVLCIGYAGDYSDVMLAKDEAEEPKVLTAFWNLASSNGDGVVVTWNGQWDLRFIVIRSLAHGITPKLSPTTIRAWFAKYRTHPHFDCKAVLTNWEPFKAGEGLSEWASFLGCDGKCDGMTGADVVPLYQLGHFDEITSYCAQDVAATHAVYQRIAPMFAGERF